MDARPLPDDLDELLGPRDVVAVEGADAATYLHSQVSQDLVSMQTGDRRWTFVLDPTGKVESLARVTRSADDRFELDTDAGFGAALLARLDRFRIRVAAVTSLAEAPATQPSPDAERRRVAAGWPRLGAEIVPHETIPAGTGLAGVAINFTKGCYPGQELVERMDSRGADAPRFLCQVDVGADAAPGDPIVDTAGETVGELTSVADGVGLGWVRRGSNVGRRVRFEG